MTSKSFYRNTYKLKTHEPLIQYMNAAAASSILNLFGCLALDNY